MTKTPMKVTVQSLRAMKERGERIAMLTAYDASFAHLLDEAGVDILLVGDSAGMVYAGHDNTLPVTLDEMIYHCRAVSRGGRRAQVVGDMPFMSYQASLEEGVRNAGRMIKEGGAEAVKLEGGVDVAELARRLARIGIPVMGHIGLTPQSVHALGGFKVQGRDHAGARRILDDARALEAAGCYSLVLESIPTSLARSVTESVSIPTIGIGAGPHCDGQVLVIYDVLGMDEGFHPRFVKQYEHLAGRIRSATRAYVNDVRSGLFPTEEHGFAADDPAARREVQPYGASAVAGEGEAQDEPANVIQHPACGRPRHLDESKP